MIISCPECSTEFEIDPAQIKEKGVKVQCSNCAHKWRIYPPNSQPSQPQATFIQQTDLQGEQGFAVGGSQITQTQPQAQQAQAQQQASASAPPPPQTADPAAPPAPESALTNDSPQFADQNSFQNDGQYQYNVNQGLDDPFNIEGAGPNNAINQRDVSEGDAASLIDGLEDNYEEYMENKAAPTIKKAPVAAWVVLGVLIVLTLSFVIYSRNALIVSYPALNNVFGLIGLDNSDLGYGVVFAEPKPSFIRNPDQPSQLIITGTMSNNNSDVVIVYALRGVLYNSRQEVLHSWFFEPEEDVILPGEIVRYYTEVIDPPRGIVDITITVASKEEVEAGIPDHHNKDKNQSIN